MIRYFITDFYIACVINQQVSRSIGFNLGYHWGPFIFSLWYLFSLIFADPGPHELVLQLQISVFYHYYLLSLIITTQLH